MKRIFDFLFAIFLLSILIIPMTLIALIIKLTSSGTVIYWSDRVGRDNNIFQMPKYRTMDINTPDVATHLLENPEEHYTPIGKILRESSLDELPQLWSIICGKMSFVGPRPALFNEDYLIKLRKIKSIDKLVPGLTGWAQINGRDDLDVKEKVSLDLVYLKNCSLVFDLKILFLTFILIFRKKNILH